MGGTGYDVCPFPRLRFVPGYMVDMKQGIISSFQGGFKPTLAIWVVSVFFLNSA